jgi:type IV secretory pathway protease TraF
VRRSPLRRPGVLVMASFALASVVALALPVAAGSAQLVWNVTPSAPAGLYRIVREPWIRGDRVAVLPGEMLGADLEQRGILAKGKLLIKRAAAVSGDRVCRHGAEVSINAEPAAKARDVASQGLLLPSWQGCVTLGAAQVFLLGDTAGSYDGRYFGVTRASDVIGRAQLLLTF